MDNQSRQALFGSVIGLTSVLSPHAAPDFAQRIARLDTIQSSLRDLDSYIGQQRSALSQLSQDLTRLRHERVALSQAAEIDRQRAEALLQIQTTAQRRREWVSVGLSFIIGVLSSVAAAMLLPFIRSRGRTRERALSDAT